MKSLIDIFRAQGVRRNIPAASAAACSLKLINDMLGMALFRMRKATLIPNVGSAGLDRLKSGIALAQPNCKEGEAHV